MVQNVKNERKHVLSMSWMPLHIVDVIIRSLERKKFCINKMAFLVLLPSQVEKAKSTKNAILLMQIFFLSNNRIMTSTVCRGI